MPKSARSSEDNNNPKTQVEEESGAIYRCPHDEENPFTMVSNSLTRDATISPNCRWLIIYLLTNINKWSINIKQVVAHLAPHMGKTKVYTIVDEAIKSGYIKREVIKRGNLIQGTKYYVSEYPKFKKCFRRPENEDPENEDPENEDPTNRDIKKNIDKKNILKNNIILPPPKVPLPKKEEAKESLRDEAPLRAEEGRKDFFSKKLKEQQIPEDEHYKFKKYTEEEISKAIEISEQVKTKGTLIGKLLNILKNPAKWMRPEKEDDGNDPERIALQYNKLLAKVNSNLAEKNDKTIPEGYLTIIDKKIGKQQVSLKADDIQKDLIEATRHLKDYIDFLKKKEPNEP